MLTGSRHPVRRCPSPEICRRVYLVKPCSFISLRSGGSKRKFQVVPKPRLDYAFDRHLRSTNNSWSGCSARRTAPLPIPLAWVEQFWERYREHFAESSQASVTSNIIRFKSSPI